MTTETVVDLTAALALTKRYAAKYLAEAEDAGTDWVEFTVSRSFAWHNGNRFVDMTAHVIVQQPIPRRFTLRLDFTGNGSEVFRLAYAERIVAWTLDLLKEKRWENIVSADSAEQVRVSHEEGFVFFVKRPSAQP